MAKAEQGKALNLDLSRRWSSHPWLWSPLHCRPTLLNPSTSIWSWSTSSQYSSRRLHLASRLLRPHGDVATVAKTRCTPSPRHALTHLKAHAQNKLTAAEENAVQQNVSKRLAKLSPCTYRNSLLCAADPPSSKKVFATNPPRVDAGSWWPVQPVISIKLMNLSWHPMTWRSFILPWGNEGLNPPWAYELG